MKVRVTALAALLVSASSASAAERFLFLPFRDPAVALQQGPLYTDGSRHLGGGFALDYIRGDLDQSPTWRSFEVVAAASGVAIRATERGYGHLVLIRHDIVDELGRHYFTLYAHLDPTTINPALPERSRYDTQLGVWERVEAGEYLGMAGQTGKHLCMSTNCIHLHMEVFRGGYFQNPVDPYDVSDEESRHDRSHYPPVASPGCGANSLWTECPPVVKSNGEPVCDASSPFPNQLIKTSLSAGTFELNGISPIQEWVQYLGQGRSGTVVGLAVSVDFDNVTSNSALQVNLAEFSTEAAARLGYGEADADSVRRITISAANLSSTQADYSWNFIEEGDIGPPGHPAQRGPLEIKPDKFYSIGWVCSGDRSGCKIAGSGNPSAYRDVDHTLKWWRRQPPLPYALVEDDHVKDAFFIFNPAESDCDCPEDCGNSRDDDCDGLTDCDDADCATASPCLQCAFVTTGYASRDAWGDPDDQLRPGEWGDEIALSFIPQIPITFDRVYLEIYHNASFPEVATPPLVLTIFDDYSGRIGRPMIAATDGLALGPGFAEPSEVEFVMPAPFGLAAGIRYRLVFTPEHDPAGPNVFVCPLSIAPPDTRALVRYSWGWEGYSSGFPWFTPYSFNVRLCQAVQ